MYKLYYLEGETACEIFNEYGLEDIEELEDAAVFMEFATEAEGKAYVKCLQKHCDYYEIISDVDYYKITDHKLVGDVATKLGKHFKEESLDHVDSLIEQLIVTTDVRSVLEGFIK